jgi:hypothetical protein
METEQKNQPTRIFISNLALAAGIGGALVDIVFILLFNTGSIDMPRLIAYLALIVIGVVLRIL